MLTSSQFEGVKWCHCYLVDGAGSLDTCLCVCSCKMHALVVREPSVWRVSLVSRNSVVCLFFNVNCMHTLHEVGTVIQNNIVNKDS